MDELKHINLAEPDQTAQKDNTLMEDRLMEPKKTSRLVPLMVMLGIFLGLGSGFYFAKTRLMASGSPSLTTGTQTLDSSTRIKVGDTFGSADEKTFRDQAEGILLAGGIDGEGSHHLERGANKSQWVYVTSSVVDLDLLVGDRVTIWGETNQGKKAGWLMDVGRLKVLELNAATPSDATGAQE